MNLSVKGEYALHALFDLAYQRQGEPVKIAEIAKRQNIPQKFLELILASLKQGGFVTSRRGAEGGYLLARSPDQLRVGDVLRFVEGGRSSTQGQRRPDGSPFASMWQQVDRAVSDVVDSTTFGDLVRVWRERQAQYVPNWDI